MAVPKLEFKNISKSFNDQMVLHDFNLQVNEGEMITIVGTSGCGKTTAIKMVNELVLPDQGKILMDGEDISLMDKNKLRQSIGYAIQNNGLFPHMTVYENIAYVLNLKKENKEVIDKRVHELVGLLDLDVSFLKRYPSQLSGGQQQRVGIARALAANPKLLLMDEPFGALDAITRVKLQKELKELQRKLKLTILFVTHDLQEAYLLGDRILIMNQGGIEQIGSYDEIVQRPKTDFVKELLNAFQV